MPLIRKYLWEACVQFSIAIPLGRLSDQPPEYVYQPSTNMINKHRQFPRSI